MRALVVAVLLVALAAAGRAQSVHLADDHQVGFGGQIGGLTGTLSGVTVGVGVFDDDRVNQYAIQGTLPIGPTHLDIDLHRAETTTIARGGFSFDQVFFAGGANVDLALTWLELVWRLHLLERPAMRISLLGGGRILNASITAKTTTRKAGYDDTLVLPEVGGVLEARIYPRARLYALIKWLDITSQKSGNHTLELETGLSYLLDSQSESTIGWRATGGFRYLNLQATSRVGEPDQAQFDVSTVGPFLEFARVF